jgi:alcohol dehydrogenase
MKALVCRGPGKKQLEDMPKLVPREATDALVRINKTTICGTDLHILKDDRVLISCITACGNSSLITLRSMTPSRPMIRLAMPGGNAL